MQLVLPLAPAQAPAVVMLGTDPDGKGGVAAVVTALREAGLFERHAVRYLPTHRAGSRAAKLGAWLGALARLWRASGATPRPIVHAHTASWASFYRKSSLLAVARLRGCRTVFHLHGGKFQEFAGPAAHPALRWWIRRTLQKSSAVIALSDSWSVFLQGYAPGAAVHVVPNGVQVNLAASEVVQHEARILFLGRAERNKGIFELIEAVAALPGVELAVGGDGDLAPLRALAAALGAARRVHFLGWVGPQQKAEELARCTLFCLPSYDEGLPMAMLEAMAAARAVVVTPVGGIPDVVVDGANGLLVAGRDAAALTSAIGRLLADPALRQGLAHAGRQTVVQRYSTDVMAARLSAIYGELGQGSEDVVGCMTDRMAKARRGAPE